MLTTATGTIAASGSLSGAITIKANGNAIEQCRLPVNFKFDDAWTTGAVTFQGAGPDGVFVMICDRDTQAELSIAGVVKGQSYPLPIYNFLGYSQIKIRSGTAGTPVTQASTTVCTVTLDTFG